MRDWLKFYFLSFFSDKTASEAPDRRVFSHFVSLFIAFVLFVATLVAADFLSFSVHYGNSASFNALVNKAFAGEQSARIALNVTDGRITAAKGDGELIKGKIINSFDGDGEYAVDGYNIVVDTRSMSAYDAFDMSFDGTGITAEQYEDLSFSAKKNFTPKVILTDKERVLDEEYIAKCSEYLESMSDATGQNYDKDISDRYAEIKNLQSSDEKNRMIYALYLQAYYPSVFHKDSGIPNLRNYYAQTYMENASISKYLFVFEDMIVGSFETESGLSRMFYGYASKLDDGLAVTATDAAQAEKQIEKFIKSAYNGSFGISVYLYFINSRRIFLFAILIWLVLALVAFGISRAVKRDIPKKFGDWFKIAGSFIFWSAVITSAVGFVCGFFVSLNTVFALITPLFGGLMLVRLTVFFLVAALRNTQPQTEIAASATDDIFDSPDNSESNSVNATPAKKALNQL